LHPRVDSIDEHIRAEPNTGVLLPLTDTGRFHVQILQLNRPELITFRRNRRAAELKAELLKLLQRENVLQQQAIDALRLLVIELGGDGG
jgi:hypothetical protein